MSVTQIESMERGHERGMKKILNLGVESARTGERERLHSGTDVKIHLPQEHLCGLVDSHSTHGGGEVVAQILAQQCGSVLDRQLENYQAARQATPEQAWAFVDRQIWSALEEAKNRLEAHYVKQQIPENFRRAFSLGLVKISDARGTLCAHIFQTGEMLLFICRGKKHYEIEKDTAPSEDQDIPIDRVEVREGDRLIFINDEVMKALSSEELGRLFAQHPNARGTEQAIQQATIRALEARQRKPKGDADVSAVVFDIRKPEPAALKPKKEETFILSISERRQLGERITLLGQEIAGLERNLSHARERGAFALEQAELAEERWRLERKKAQLEYQFAFSEVMRLREKYPPLFEKGDLVRNQEDVLQKTGWVVMGFDNRMVLPPQGAFNDQFGMYQIHAPGSDRSQWVNQFQLEGWQGGTPTDQHQRTLGFEAHQQLRQSITAFHHADEQHQLWKGKHQTLVAEQARQQAHGVKKSQGQGGEGASHKAEKRGGQEEAMAELEKAVKELQDLEKAKVDHALPSAKEARRRVLYLTYIAPYGGWRGVDHLLRQWRQTGGESVQ